jgi:hypothetical protein
VCYLTSLVSVIEVPLVRSQLTTFAIESVAVPCIKPVVVKRGNIEGTWAQRIVAGDKSRTFTTAILSDSFHDGLSCRNINEGGARGYQRTAEWRKSH